jgi:hypothetical protein
MANDQPRDLWSKLSVASTALAVPLVTLVLGYFGHRITQEVQNREVDVKVMNVAVSVLQLSEEQAGEGIRNWAWEVLQRHSDVPIPDDVRRTATLPLGVVQEQTPETAPLTDVDVFVCESDETQPSFVTQSRLANDGAHALKEAGFGRIRTSVWRSTSEFSVEELRGATTVVLDVDHLEAREFDRIKSALEPIDGLPGVRQAANPGQVSEWYISVVICTM